jgi:hypothetical protein
MPRHPDGCLRLLAYWVARLPAHPHRSVGTALARLTSCAYVESPSLVLVINDTKLLMPCVKCD